MRLRLHGAAFLVFLLIGVGCSASPAPTTWSETSSPVSATTTSPSAPSSSITQPENTTTAPEGTVSTTENFVRFINPGEWTGIMQQCMVDSGWPVTTTPDGGIDYPEVTSEQADQMLADFDVCNHQKFPIDPKYLQPYTESQMTYLYEWYLDESIPCLENHGYTGFDPPSLDVFVDTFETPSRWAPYLDIGTEQIPPGAWYTLNEECPQYPPAEDILAH